MEKIENYTRNEWRRLKQPSVSVSLSESSSWSCSRRTFLNNIYFYKLPTRLEFSFASSPLLSSVVLHTWTSRYSQLLSPFPKSLNLGYGLRSCPLISSVFCYLLHSFRVYFVLFSTHFECILLYSRLILSFSIASFSLFLTKPRPVIHHSFRV